MGWVEGKRRRGKDDHEVSRGPEITSWILTDALLSEGKRSISGPRSTVSHWLDSHTRATYFTPRRRETTIPSDITHLTITSTSLTSVDIQPS